MDVLDPKKPAHAPVSPKNIGGRPHGARAGKRLLSTVKFRELCIKHLPEALDIIMKIARSGEPDAARFLAAKFIIERGYGLPDGENPGGGMTVRVITGVRESGDPSQHTRQGRRLPDRARSAARRWSIHRQHRLFEGDPEIPSVPDRK